MTTIRANRQGEILQIVPEAQLPQVQIPEGTAFEFVVDAETNTDLLLNLAQDINSYRLVDAVLSYRDVPVAVQPPSADRQRLLTLREANQAVLDETRYENASPQVRQLAQKVAWLELEWRGLQLKSTRRSTLK